MNHHNRNPAFPCPSFALKRLAWCSIKEEDRPAYPYLRFTERFFIQQPVDHLLLFLGSRPPRFSLLLRDSDRQIRYDGSVYRRRIAFQSPDTPALG